MYTNTVENLEAENKREPSKTFKPSSMKCLRGMVYGVLGVKRDNNKTPQALCEICANGSERHQSIQSIVNQMHKYYPHIEFVDVGKYIKENNIPLKVKKESNFAEGIFETHLISEKYNVSFLCDGMLKIKGKYYILEIKTSSSGKFMKQKDVQDDHKVQATAYSFLLGVDSVIFFYENRDILSKKGYLYKPSKLEKQELKLKLEEGLNLVENKIIPEKPKECTGRDKMSQYCPYKGRCKSDGEKEVKYIDEEQV